jgi:hypothetical protein
MNNSALHNNYPFTLISTYHKPFPFPNNPVVKPVHAGKSLSALDLNIEGDNIGENISNLNPYFSELTVVYYIWKNYSKLQMPYWGLCHYRRYFTLHLSWLKFKSIYHLTSPENAFNKIFTPTLLQTIQSELEKGKVILSKPYVFIKLKKWSVKKQFIKDHGAASWICMEKVVEELYPGYVNSMNSVANGLTCSWYNMLIADWSFWDRYLTWLFDILFEVKKNLDKSDDKSDLRIYGNLSERLLNIYIHYWQRKGQQVFHLPVAHITSV